MSDANNSQQQKAAIGKKSPETFPVKLPPAPVDPQSQSSTDPTTNSHVNTNGQAAHQITDSNDTNTNEDTNGMSNQNGPTNETRLRAVSSADEYFKNQTKSAKFSTRVSVTGTIPGRQYHTAINYEDFMFVYGGFSAEKSVFSELYCFHYGTRSWTLIENDVNATNLTPRYDHSAVVYGDSMFIFGGMSPQNTLLDDLWEFKFETQSWSAVQGENKPSSRKGHTAVVHENSMYVIGGINADNKPLDDVWEFSFDTFRWTKLAGGSNFPGRFHHTAVVFKDSVFVFGGATLSSTSAAAESKLSDFWEYKIKNRTWSALTIGLCPPGRTDHTAVVFQNSMYLCGGGETGLFEVFEFDFDFRKWFKIQLSTSGEVPSPKQAFSAVVRGDCIFFFGGSPVGSSESAVLQDLDYLCLGKDEFEEELELDEMAKMQNIPKSLWEATCMKKHPELLELREKIRPLSQSSSYARSVTSARTEAKSAVSHNQVLQLIMEYLEHQGFSKVVETIQEESNIPFEKSNYEESRLLTLMRIGRRRIRHKDVFSPDITLADYDETDPEVPVVDRLPKRSLDAVSEQQDVNIWDEIMDCYTNGTQGKKNISLVTPEGVEITTSTFQDKVVIKGATLNRLVQVLTSEKEKVQDLQFVKTFLYTYQSFTSPEMLLKKLIQRYHVPYPLPKEYITANTFGSPSTTDATSDVISLDNFKTELQQPIRTRVCSVIKYWIDRCGWDFDEKLQSSLKSFIDGPLSRDGNLSLVKQLRNSISKLQKKKFFLEEDRAYVFGVNPPEPKVPRNIFSPNLSLKDIDEVEIARQLTLIEYSLFSQIIPTELLNKCWCDADKRHKAPHIMEMQTRFDDIANWVATTILTVDSQSTTPSSTAANATTSQSSSASLTNTKKARARMIEKYIKIAEHLKTLKNFQTLFAILTGLNSAVITSLTQTFAELQLKTKETLNELLAIMSKDSNYKTYREFLRYSALPCIPYIEVTLKDILSIEEQGDYIGNMINFQKRQQLYKAITSLQGYQQRPYNLQPVHQIATFLNNFSRKDEKDLAELAAKLEPKK